MNRAVIQPFITIPAHVTAAGLRGCYVRSKPNGFTLHCTGSAPLSATSCACSPCRTPTTRTTARSGGREPGCGAGRGVAAGDRRPGPGVDGAGNGMECGQPGDVPAAAAAHPGHGQG